jgi:hypothetical protein
LKELPPQSGLGSDGFYAVFRHLSLDVAAGALGAGFMVAGLLEVSMHWSWYVVLPLAVWVIYTVDHLLDAIRLKEKAHTARHRFHDRNFGVLAVCAAVAALTCIGLALAFLGHKGLYFGLGMGVLVLLHLLLVKFVGERTSPFLVKELGVALVYVLGIWGLPLLVSGRWNDALPWLCIGQFLLLAMTNLLEFSFFEFETDTQDGHTSFVRALGKSRSIRLIRIVLASSALVGIAVLWQYDGRFVIRVEFIFGLMAAILWLLMQRRDWFAVGERYRVWGDGAFLLPFLFPLMDWL